MSDFVKVARISDIPQGKGKVVELNGRAIALFNAGGNFYAMDNCCPHKGAPLAEGVVIDNLVICPWHRWTFDLTSGKCTVNPMAPLVACFEVKVEGEDICLKT